MAIKRDSTDKWFAAYMDCAHIFSRMHKSTRWHPDAALCLCRRCHQYYGGRPTEFTAFVKTTMTDELYDEIHRIHHTPFRSTKQDRLDAAKWFRAQHKEICERREKGEDGYINFAGYW